MHRRIFFPFFVVAAAGVVAPGPGAVTSDPFQQSDVPIEMQPPHAAQVKIVLVAGKPSHGPGEHEHFAGCALLMKMLQQTPGVFPVLAREWPRDSRSFEGARALVFYMDGGGRHPITRDHHPDEVGRVLARGAGFVNLHFAVEYPKEFGPRILTWLGGYYEKDYSINPHWTATIQSLPDHPITRGVHPFQMLDEWYYGIRFEPDRKGVTPILQAVPPEGTRRTEETRRHPGREEVLAWAFNRADGGRSFGFTGGHFHRNWSETDFRRLVVNAILWSAHVEVPREGAKVDFDSSELWRHLDRKRPVKKK